MSRREIAEAILARLQDGFRYTTDQEQFGKSEDWRSAIDAVRKKAAWRDDCDGHALTAAELAVEDYDVPKADVALVYCKTETGGGHLVCFLSSPTSTWVIDNRQRAIWSPGQIRYKWISGLTIGESTWRKPGGQGS